MPRIPIPKPVGAPSNYVAGLGRGAVGFTTRSDIGPARTLPEAGEPGAPSGADPDFGPAPVGYVAGRGRGMGDLAKANSEAGANRSGGRGAGGRGAGATPGATDLSESNFDEFSGYQERLFGDTPYDNDDEEADRIYEVSSWFIRRHVHIQGITLCFILSWSQDEVGVWFWGETRPVVGGSDRGLLRVSVRVSV